MTDTSTIPVTIGLDVLDHLIKLASTSERHSQVDRIVLQMAKNAAEEAFDNAPSITIISKE